MPPNPSGTTAARAWELASMDVDGSSCPAAPSSSPDIVKRRRWIQSPVRRALPAVLVLAATVLAVAVISASGNGSTMVPSSWFSVQDVPPTNLTAEQLLDGLLTAEFVSRSCRSRYEFTSYHHNKRSHKPSPYLLAKLRRQEALQKRCGPGTAPYRAAIRQLKSGNGADTDDCRYLVSMCYRGLGNRMLATASAYLYAVLTERALLVHHDVGALFCEPFPGTTWLLPSSGWLGGGFPLAHLGSYGIGSKESLGNMLKANVLSVLGGVRPWIMPATPIWEPDTEEVPDPPCVRAMSVEPCFHSPSYYDCAARKDVDVGKVVPYIRLCEDVSWGIKIANESSQW